MHRPAVREGVAQEVEHRLPSGSVGVVAQLESEAALSALDPENDFDVDLVGGRAEFRPTVVHPEEPQAPDGLQ